MKLRLAVFIGINAIIVIIYVVYLFQIQILDAHHLEDITILRQNPSKTLLPPSRGNIYDTNRMLLVSSMKYYQLDLDVRTIRNNCERNNLDFNKTINTISDLISGNSGLKKDFIQKKLLNASGSVFLTDDLSETEHQTIIDEFEKHKIPGIISKFSRMKRLYPQDKSGSNFLGVVVDNRDDANSGVYTLQGLSGIESTYNDLLKGSYGWQETIYDAQNRRIPMLYLKERPPTDGNNLVLTIDNNLQEILDEKLNLGLRAYKAKNAIGIIMDPFTGAILAMSGINEHDHRKTAAELRSRANLPASFMFEPGSVLKPITALLALENNLFKPDDVIDCRDLVLNYGNIQRKIKDDHKYTKLNFRDIIAYSSNVGISRIVEQVGSKTLYDRMIDMGLGRKICRDIAGEASGILRNQKDWQGFSLHSIAFGQEISVTAIQLAAVFSTFANGGNVMQPYLCKQILDSHNRVVENIHPKVLSTISDIASLDTLKVFLKSVVDYGTATATKIDYIEVAGKTGTAEKSISGEHGYSKDKYTSVFAGFFPVQKPKYVIVVVYDEPDYESYAYYSALSAVPTFRKIVTDIINLPHSDIILEIKEAKKEFVFTPMLFGMNRLEAESTLKKSGIGYEIVEKNKNGKVINQYPKPNTAFDVNEKIVLILDVETTKQVADNFDYKMPDLGGLTLREALAKATAKNIKLIISGSGIIYEQSIPAGSKTSFGEQCIVKAK
jgi:cell division protein FtsI/penicillin-binding protein 2